MSRLRTRIIPIAVAAGVALLAVLLFRPQPTASWITLDAPPHTIAGEPFVGTITLREPAAGHYLAFDFHGLDTHRDTLGCVAAGRSQLIDPARHTYTFTLTVPVRADIAQVRGVIYVSTTGQWQDRVAVANVDPIRVFAADAAAFAGRPGYLAVHDQVDEPAVVLIDPPAVRILGAALWLACAVLAWRARPRLVGERTFPVLASLCLVAAIWEAAAPAVAIADFARSLAQQHHVYNDRRWLQQAATLAIVIGLGALAVIGVQRSRRRASAAAIAGLCAYAAVAFATTLTLHEIDYLLAVPVFTIPLASILRLAAASAVLAGTISRLATAQKDGTLP